MLDVLARSLFTHDARDRLVDVNEAGGPRAPRVFLAWDAEGVLGRVRDDVADDVAAQIALLTRGPGSAELLAPLACADAVRAVIAPITEEEGSVQYRFADGDGALRRLDDDGAHELVAVTAANSAVIQRWLPTWAAYAREADAALPMFASLIDGAAVAVCATVRTPSAATQAGVETHPDFRGHGHAAAVTAAWARAIRARGVVPLYGTSWSNTGSQRVAARLGLVAFAGSLSFA